MILGEQHRPPGCLSDLALDRLFAGELAGVARKAADDHLRGCERCRHKRAEMAAEREAFLGLRPQPEPAMRPLRRRGLPARPGLAAVMALAAALAAFVLLVARRGPEEGVRRKGGEQVGFLVERGGAAERRSPSAVLHPGDRVRFTYTVLRDAHLAIYGLDASGVASVYFPASERAERVRAGAETVANTAVELDGVLGSERIFALFCDAGFAVEPFRKALAQARTLEAPEGCRLRTFEWRKERSHE